jgi:hypothetical protein
MMTLLLRDLPGSIHKVQSLPEIFKTKVSFKALFTDDSPIPIQFRSELLECLPF